MYKRVFYYIGSLVIVLSFAGPGIYAQHITKKRPNIILLLADDLGYGDVGCYGQQKIRTPNIDRLAVMGLRFTQFYSGSTVCAPARASFMTGLHTGHSVIRGNKSTLPEGQMPLPASAVTIANLMQKQGYTTAAFGKWSLGFITTTGDPELKGFDEFYGYNCQTLAHNYYPDHLWHNHERINMPGNLTYDSVYSADLIHQNAMRFLQSKHDKPFFLYLPYTLPHADVFVPHDSVYDNYVREFNEQPVPIKQSNDGEKHHFDPYPHAAFAAMVSRLDKYVGEILKAVEEEGIAENTLVIFTSDNGPHRENGGDPDFFNSSGGFRGIKRDLYEGGIREPFIAYWKGTIKPGTREDAAILYDLFPTFQQLAGMPVSSTTDGISLLPVLLGSKNKQHEYLYWEFHEAGGRQAVRWGNWKGVRLNVSAQASSPLELYNLQTDPLEKNNVAAPHPEIVKGIEKKMDYSHIPNKDWPLLFKEKK